MTNSIYSGKVGQLYRIVHEPTGLIYYGSCWAKDKTHLERFKEHLEGMGGVYIKKLLNDGASKEDFTVELLGIYPLAECLEREKDLAGTSLFPKGLNGNAGYAIMMTEEVYRKLSESAHKRVLNGTHNFLDGEISKRTQAKRIEEGTHHFLDGEIQRKYNHERVLNGTHPFLGRRDSKEVGS